MSWFDWLSGLLGPSSGKVTSLGDKVTKLEEQADAAETEAKLRTRAVEARRRIKAAGGPANRRFATWVAIVILILFIFLFFRTCF